MSVISDVNYLQMDYSIETFKNELLSLNIKYNYHKYLLGNSVWYFEKYLNLSNPSEEYDSFKSYIAGKFDLPFNNVAIVGSAKLGFSIAPDNNLSMFRVEDSSEKKASDIDLVLVSSSYFNIFWEEYLNKYLSNNYSKEFYYARKCIFKKFITFRGFDNSDKTYVEWMKKTINYQKELQEKFHIKHKVNYLIFESWEAAEKYYCNNLKQIQANIRSEMYA